MFIWLFAYCTCWSLYIPFSIPTEWWLILSSNRCGANGSSIDRQVVDRQHSDQTLFFFIGHLFMHRWGQQINQSLASTQLSHAKKKDEKQWSKNETCAQKKRKKNSVISGTTSCGTRLFVDGCSLMMDQTSLNICCPFCSLSNRSCANFFATRLIVCNSSAKRVRISIRYGGSTDIF